MAIKLTDVFECINKRAAEQQDPGAQAMEAAAQAATPPGGIPLPKPIDKSEGEEDGKNMIPEEKVQAEKEKLELQRRAELEKKENEIRGLQHELDLERVERQKATAEKELDEKRRQQDEQLKQERAKLDAERQKLEQDKALQSNTQQAELIKHQADMERETSKQMADIAQQKAKAIEDIAKQNAQQYIKTTQQSQQQANRYFAEQQKKFRAENPAMSTALQNQINNAVSAAKRVTNHHRKIASFIPMPSSAPIIKYAATSSFDTFMDGGNRRRSSGSSFDTFMDGGNRRGGYNNSTGTSGNSSTLGTTNSGARQHTSSTPSFDRFMGAGDRKRESIERMKAEQEAQQRHQEQNRNYYTVSGIDDNGLVKSVYSNLGADASFADRARALGTAYGQIRVMPYTDKYKDEYDKNKDYYDLEQSSIRYELENIQKEVDELRNRSDLTPEQKKQIADYDLLTQKKLQAGRAGWIGAFENEANRFIKSWENSEGFWDSLGSVVGSIGRSAFLPYNELMDNTEVELSDLDALMNGGTVGKPEDIYGNWVDRNIGIGRLLEDSAVARGGDVVIGQGLRGVGSAIKGVGDTFGWDSWSATGDGLSMGGRSMVRNPTGRITMDLGNSILSGIPQFFGNGLLGGGYFTDSGRYGKQVEANNLVADLNEDDKQELLKKYNVSENPGWNTLGRAGFDALYAVPFVKTFTKPFGIAARVPKAVNIGSVPASMVGEHFIRPYGSAMFNDHQRYTMDNAKRGIEDAIYNLSHGGSNEYLTDAMMYLDTLGTLDPGLAEIYAERMKSEIPNYYNVVYNNLEGKKQILELQHKAGNLTDKDYNAAIKAIEGQMKDVVEAAYYQQMQKSSSYIPLPGSAPMEKKAAIDEWYRNTPQGRNAGWGFDQALSPYYNYDKYRQHPLMGYVEQIVPIINMITGGNFNIDYDVTGARQNAYKPIKAEVLGDIISNPSSDPLTAPKGKSYIKSQYNKLKDLMKAKYSANPQNYTTIPTAQSNVFSVPQ